MLKEVKVFFLRLLDMKAFPKTLSLFLKEVRKPVMWLDLSPQRF